MVNFACKQAKLHAVNQRVLELPQVINLGLLHKFRVVNDWVFGGCISESDEFKFPKLVGLQRYELALLFKIFGQGAVSKKFDGGEHLSIHSVNVWQIQKFTEHIDLRVG